MRQETLGLGLINPDEAPDGYRAVLKSDVDTGVNFCRHCDWRPHCDGRVRCFPYEVRTPTGEILTRKDRCSVVFKKIP